MKTPEDIANQIFENKESGYYSIVTHRLSAFQKKEFKKIIAKAMQEYSDQQNEELKKQLETSYNVLRWIFNELVVEKTDTEKGIELLANVNTKTIVGIKNAISSMNILNNKQ